MKKAMFSIFAFILATAMMLSASISVSAENTEVQDYEPFFWEKLGQYRDEMTEKYGEDFAMVDYFYYDELFRYYSGDEGATPDFVLVNATYYYNTTPFAYRYNIGEFIYDDSTSGDRCLIYIPENDTVYTLEEAYRNRLEGLEEAFAQIYSLALGKTGDTNGDTKVNIHDVTYIQQYLANMIECGNSNPYINGNPRLFDMVSDVNLDHKISIKDATVIQKQLAKLLIPTVYDKTPASADSIEYKEVEYEDNFLDLAYNDRLVTDINMWQAYPHSHNIEYTEEFFEENALVHIYRTYYTGMVKGSVEGVYREGNTLYVKYNETHPSGGPVTDDIGVFNVVLEIDKDLLEGVDNLVIDQNRYPRP